MPTASEPQVPRIAILGFVLEANRKAPVSDRRAFEETLYLDGEGIARELKGDRAGLPNTVRGFCAEMDGHGDWIPVPILLAEAPPGGPADHAFFVEMIDTMDAGLRQSDAVDGVYICEHGAGLSTELDDADGALFAMVRAIVGPDVPVIATLDLHRHVTPRMNDAADVMVSYLTNPHVDGEDRGREAAQIMLAMLAGVRTHSILVRVPMISPVGQLADGARSLRRSNRLRSKPVGATDHQHLHPRRLRAGGCHDQRYVDRCGRTGQRR